MKHPLLCEVSSYYHGNDSNITMDEQAELISLKYLRRHQLINQGITLSPVVTKETEFSMATQQYLQRHGLDDTSKLEQMKPYNSSNDNNHNDNNMVATRHKKVMVSTKIVLNNFIFANQLRYSYKL